MKAILRLPLLTLIVMMGAISIAAVTGVDLWKMVGGWEGLVSLLVVLVVVILIALGLWAHGKMNYSKDKRLLAWIVAGGTVLVLVIGLVGFGLLLQNISKISILILPMIAIIAVMVTLIWFLGLSGRKQTVTTPNP